MSPEGLVARLLAELGEDTGRAGIKDTPRRVSEALVACFAGYGTSSDAVIGNAVFPEPAVEGTDGVVLVRHIDFAATCERTLLPFFGQCHVAYVPSGPWILGLSKLARLVHAFSKRLSSGAQLARDVLDAVQTHVPCQGVFVLVQWNTLQPALDEALQAGSHRNSHAASGCFLRPGAPAVQAEVMLRMGGVQCPSLRAGGAAAAQVTPAHTTHAPSTAAAAPAEAPSTSNAPAAGGTPAVIAQIVQDLYDALLSASGSPRGLTADAALRHASILLHQTSGYKATLEQLVAQHKLRSKPLAAISATPENPAMSCVSAASAPNDLLGMVPASDSAPVATALRPSDLPADAAPPSLESSSTATCSHSCCSMAATAPDMDADGSHMEGSEVGSDAAPASKLVLEWCPAGRVCWGVSAVPAGSPSAPVQQRWLRVYCVPFTSLCEHHMLPFHGEAYLVLSDEAAASAGFGQRVDGATDLVADVVELFTRRLQVQERITNQLADAFDKLIGGELGGALLACSAAHMCMVSRGVEKHGAATMTVASRGCFSKDLDLQAVALEVVSDAAAAVVGGMRSSTRAIQ